MLIVISRNILPDSCTLMTLSEGERRVHLKHIIFYYIFLSLARYPHPEAHISALHQ
jgi:hypothetical protein